MTSAVERFDPLEAAIVASAVRALRRRAGAQSEKAAAGVSLCGSPPVVIVASEARRALDIANDLDAIADELEGATG
jgi:hypothetical protein